MVTSSLIACLVVLAGVAVAYPGRFLTFAAHHFANTRCFKSQLPRWLKATQFFDDVDLLSGGRTCTRSKVRTSRDLYRLRASGTCSKMPTSGDLYRFRASGSRPKEVRTSGGLCRFRVSSGTVNVIS